MKIHTTEFLLFFSLTHQFKISDFCQCPTSLHPMLLPSWRPSHACSRGGPQFPSLCSYICGFVSSQLSWPLLADTSASAGPASRGQCPLGQDSSHLRAPPRPCCPACSPSCSSGQASYSLGGSGRPKTKKGCVFCCRLGNIPLTFWCYTEGFKNHPQISIKMLQVNNMLLYLKTFICRTKINVS